jgi:hypothetical protein
MASTAGPTRPSPKEWRSLFFKRFCRADWFAVKATGWIQRSIAALAGPTHCGQATSMRRERLTAFDLFERKAVLGVRGEQIWPSARSVDDSCATACQSPPSVRKR